MVYHLRVHIGTAHFRLVVHIATGYGVYATFHVEVLVTHLVAPYISAFHHDVNVVTCSFFHRFADAVIHCFGFLRIDFACLVLDVNYRACAA
nr:hypothetical protein [Bacteroides acidifaciens]